MKRLLLLLLLASPASASEFLTHPNQMLTPGVTRDLSLRTICRTKWGADERGVTKAMKDNVAEKYMFDVATCPFTKIKGKRVRRFEIDHLIPRSIGGADEEANLWPQCYEPPMADKSQQADGANKKDRLEKFLNKDVCKKRSPELLAEYQQKIRTDWRGLYQEIYGDE